MTSAITLYGEEAEFAYRFLIDSRDLQFGAGVDYRGIKKQFGIESKRVDKIVGFLEERYVDGLDISGHGKRYLMKAGIRGFPSLESAPSITL